MFNRELKQLSLQQMKEKKTIYGRARARVTLTLTGEICSDRKIKSAVWGF